METQTTITYEIVVPETNKKIVTEYYSEALDYYEKGCMVFEHHRTITQPNLSSQTSVRVTLRWLKHPEIEED